MCKWKRMKLHAHFSNGAFSFIEILIAVTILLIVVSMIIHMIRSFGRETSFSSEHYTAMFLAQKVLEDISSRIQDNPYFFSVLISKGANYPEAVTDGKSEYFRLLENTTNFNRLSIDEDLPITGGHLYDQLRNFTVQVSSGFRLDPQTGSSMENLLEVTATVRWQSRDSRPQEYIVTQMFQGFSQDAMKQMPDLELSPKRRTILDQKAITAISDMIQSDIAQGGIEEIARLNHPSDPACLMNVGRISWMCNRCLESDADMANLIDKLETQRDTFENARDTVSQLAYMDLQRRIAQLYEQKAVQLVGFLLLIKEPLDGLTQAVKTEAPTMRNEGFPLGPGIFPAKAFRITALFDNISLIVNLVPLALSSAEKTTFSLLRSPYLELIPARFEPAFLRRALDIQKLGILRQPDKHDARMLMRSLKRNINAFQVKYEGLFPNFSAYLAEEERIASSLESLQEHYAAAVKVFEYLDNMSQEAEECKNSVLSAMPIQIEP